MTIPPAITKPIWADFPTVEYQARVSRCQELMAAAGLDVLMLTQQENVEYFSGLVVESNGVRPSPSVAVSLSDCGFVHGNQALWWPVLWS
jgi:hypothetical protein